MASQQFFDNLLLAIRNKSLNRHLSDNVPYTLVNENENKVLGTITFFTERSLLGEGRVNRSHDGFCEVICDERTRLTSNHLTLFIYEPRQKYDDVFIFSSQPYCDLKFSSNDVMVRYFRFNPELNEKLFENTKDPVTISDTGGISYCLHDGTITPVYIEV